MLCTALHMAFTRTQVHLTKEQREWLGACAKREGKTLAAVIRDAVDAYVASEQAVIAERRATLYRTFGSNPDFEVPSRDEWEERAKRLGY